MEGNFFQTDFTYFVMLGFLSPIVPYFMMWGVSKLLTLYKSIIKI